MSGPVGHPQSTAGSGLTVNLDGVRRNAGELLAHPGVNLVRLAAIWPELLDLDAPTVEQLEIDAPTRATSDARRRISGPFGGTSRWWPSVDLDYGAIDSSSDRGEVEAGGH